MDGTTRSAASSSGYVAVGVAFAAAGIVRAGVVGGARLASASPVAEVARSSAKAVMASPVGERVGAVVSHLEEQGRREAEVQVLRVRGVVDDVARAVGTSDTMVNVVNDVVDRVIWPIVDQVLPVVLDRLAAEPDQVRALVLGQSTGIIDDLTVAARSRAAHADDRVASLVDRVLRRTRAADAARTVAPAPSG